MISIIIADENINNIKYIMNTVLGKIENSTIKTFVATNIEEINEIITCYKSDLILLNTKLKNHINININCKIIITYDNIEDNELITQIISIIEKHNNNATISLSQKVKKELQYLGFNFKLVGTNYLLEAIMYIYTENNMDLLDNLEQNVYKYLANKNNKTLSNIKTTIIKATNYLEKYQDRNLLKQYFGIDIKATPKLVITTILNKLI